MALTKVTSGVRTLGTGEVATANMAVDPTSASNLASGTLPIARVADNAVTLAKLEDGTQGDILYYGASGAPARLGFGVDGQLLKTQGTGANPAWTDAPAAGIGTASLWSLEAGVTTVDGDNVLTGTMYEQGRVGSAMTVSSGVFTFPSTGIWLITFSFLGNRGSSSPYFNTVVWKTTNDGGAWTKIALGGDGFYGSDGFASGTVSVVFDVTDVANYKVRFSVELSSGDGTGVGVFFSTSNINSFFKFERWGDT